MYIGQLRRLETTRLLVLVSCVALLTLLLVAGSRVIEPYYVVLSIPLLALMVVGTPELVFISCLAFTGMYATSGIYSMLLSSLVLLAGLLHLYSSKTRGLLRFIVISVSFFIPLVIANTSMLPPLLVMLLVFTGLIARENLRIGHSRVEVLRGLQLVYLGEFAEYTVRIELPGVFRYVIYEFENPVRQGMGVNRVEVEITRRLEYIGVNTISVKVVIEDERGLSRIVHGPYILTYTVIPRISDLIAIAEKAILKYVAYLSVPKVARLELGYRGLGGTGGLERAPGSELPRVLGEGSKGYGGGVASSEGSQGVITREGFSSSSSKDEVRVVQPPSPDSTTRSWLILAIEIMKEIKDAISRIAAKSYSGDYIGVREYQPGDSPRFIHWKKLSRVEGLDELYIKLYAREMETKGGGRGVRIIYVDLTSSSPYELDLLVTTLYSLLLKEIEHRGLSSVHVFLKIPYSDILYIEGKTIDVLVALNTIIQKYMPIAIYNYTTWRRRRTITLEGHMGFIGQLEEYYRDLGLAIKHVLESRIGKNASVTFIRSNALAYKYAIVTKILQDAGFRIFTLTR